MTAMDRRARTNAATSIRLMIAALIAAIVLTVGASLRLSRSILKSIRAVTVGARALARGELDQIVPAATRDELGELANAFNDMARTLRDYRQAGSARLLRAQKTAQATIDSFPDPWWWSIQWARSNRPILRLVVCSAWYRRPKRPFLGIRPRHLKSLVDKVLSGQGDYLPVSLEQAIPLADGGQERFFLPRVLAIRAEHEELTWRCRGAGGCDQVPSPRPA